MKRTGVKRVIKVIQNAELIVLAALLALCLGTRPFGVIPYAVLSGSMEPAMPIGSLAYIQTHAEPESVQEGSVIAFRQVGQTVTHRVFSIISLDLSNWNVSGGTTFSDMFSGDSSLKSIGNVSHWSFDAAGGASFGYMFYNCSALHVDCSQWKVPDLLTNMARHQFKTNAPGVIPPVNWK